MNRIKDIPPAEMTNEQTAVFEQLTAGRGRILTPYKVWIHSPKVASGMEHIGTFLNKKSSLSEREVEIGILVIARHWHADYVQQAHIRMAHDLGVPESTIEAICAGKDPKLSGCARTCRLRVRGGAGRGHQIIGCAIRRDRGRAEPRRSRGSTGSARLLHVGRARHEGARGPDPAALAPQSSGYLFASSTDMTVCALASNSPPSALWSCARAKIRRRPARSTTPVPIKGPACTAA